MNLNRYYKWELTESVIELSGRVDELKTLQRKLDPLNFNGADTHLSIEDKDAIWEMLGEVMMHIEILDKEIYHYWRTKQQKRKKFQFWK
jgi:hypothetical protein